jgi:hypothetical protein
MCYFKVEFLNDEGNSEMVTGFIPAEDYSSAVSALIVYYGEENLITMYIYPLEDSPLIVPEEIAEKIINGSF